MHAPNQEVVRVHLDVYDALRHGIIRSNREVIGATIHKSNIKPLIYSVAVVFVSTQHGSKILCEIPRTTYYLIRYHLQSYPRRHFHAIQAARIKTCHP